MEFLRRVRRKIIVEKYRHKNKNKDVTIISQNCIGGVIYADLDLPFMSPTINMFIEDENFVKLVENLEYYLAVEPEPLYEMYEDGEMVYPKISIGDIELCCLHYKSCQEAIDAWNRRRKRVNLKNVVVIANSWNLHNKKIYIKRLLNTKYKTIIFTTETTNLENCITLPDWGNFKLDERGIVRPNITDMIPNSPYMYFEKFFDFVKWLNEE